MKEKQWRPVHWDEVAKEITADLGKLRIREFPIMIPDGLEWDMLKRNLVEAGADAILGVLKSEGEYLHNNGNMPYGYVLGKSPKLGEKGWLIFIPDKEKIERRRT